MSETAVLLAPKKPRQGIQLRIPRKSTRVRLASAHRLRRNRRLKLRLASGKILPGQYFDQETGLHYNYFRDYDAATGRYLQPDPLGTTAGLNLFLYAGGNPVVLIDPFGLCSCRFVSKETTTLDNPHLWGLYYSANLVCSYRCTSDTSTQPEIVRSDQIDRYLRRSDRRNAVCRLSLEFPQRYDFAGLPDGFDQVDVGDFDPRDSGIPELKAWAKKNCSDCEK